MSSIITSLSNIKSPRGLGWLDYRDRSPKALNDMSGVILPRIGTNGFPQIQQLDYDTLSKIYICNDMVWTCINLVSSTAAMARLRVRTKNNAGVAYLKDHPFQNLLDFPNASMTQFDLIQAYVTHQLLYGHITCLLLRDDMQAMCKDCIKENKEDCVHKLFIYNEGHVRQIMPIHPTNVIQKKAQDGKTYFWYQPHGAAGLSYLIHPNNILTDPLYNPDIGWYGVSPTHTLLRWLGLDDALTSQVIDYFANGAIPSMIVNLRPGTNYTYDTDPTTLVEKMKEGWQSEFSGKGKKQKSPAFVYGDVNVQKVQEQINEHIGKDLYYEIQAHVCATYGVPPTLYEMGLRYGAQRASAEQHERNFYNNTISKVLYRFERKITNLILPTYKDDTLEVAWDLSEMGTADFLIKEKESRILQHWEKGVIKRDHTRVLLGYEPTGDEYGDDYYRITVMGDGETSITNQLDNNLTGPEEELPKD